MRYDSHPIMKRCERKYHTVLVIAVPALGVRMLAKIPQHFPLIARLLVRPMIAALVV